MPLLLHDSYNENKLEIKRDADERCFENFKSETKVCKRKNRFGSWQYPSSYGF